MLCPTRTITLLSSITHSLTLTSRPHSLILPVFYFDVINFFHKLILWATLVFFGYGSQLQVGTALLLCVTRLVVHARFEPYRERTDNWFDYITLIITALMGLSGLMLQYLETSKDFAVSKNDRAQVKSTMNSIHGVEVALNIAVLGVAVVFVAFLLHVAFGRYITSAWRACRQRCNKGWHRARSRCGRRGGGEEAGVRLGGQRVEVARDGGESAGARAAVSTDTGQDDGLHDSVSIEMTNSTGTSTNAPILMHANPMVATRGVRVVDFSDGESKVPAVVGKGKGGKSGKGGTRGKGGKGGSGRSQRVAPIIADKTLQVFGANVKGTGTVTGANPAFAFKPVAEGRENQMLSSTRHNQLRATQGSSSVGSGGTGGSMHVTSVGSLVGTVPSSRLERSSSIERPLGIIDCRLERMVSVELPGRDAADDAIVASNGHDDAGGEEQVASNDDDSNITMCVNRSPQTTPQATG